MECVLYGWYVVPTKGSKKEIKLTKMKIGMMIDTYCVEANEAGRKYFKNKNLQMCGVGIEECAKKYPTTVIDNILQLTLRMCIYSKLMKLKIIKKL